MTGYDFHPEAETDLDEIWDYIAAGNASAADRVIAEIRKNLDNLVPFPHGTQTRRSGQTPATLHDGAGLPHSLRAG